MASKDKSVKVTEEYSPEGSLIKKTKESPSKKTLSDWVAWGAQVLAAGAVIVSIVALAIGVSQFNAEQQSNNQKALDEQQQTTLQNYVSTMSDLLLKENLRGSQSGGVVRQVAEAQTLTALQNLNPARKGILVKFLYDSGLIFNHTIDYGSHYAGEPSYNPTIEPPLIISLQSADLSDADLSYANLEGADFFGANLRGANFSYADLRGANLSCLPYSAGCTQLSRNNFEGVNLLGADLTGAALFDSFNLTQQELDQVWSCQEANLPKGLICHHN